MENEIVDGRYLAELVVAVTISNVFMSFQTKKALPHRYSIMRRVTENILDFSRVVVIVFLIMSFGGKLPVRRQILLFYVVFGCFEKETYLHSTQLELLDRMSAALDFQCAARGRLRKRHYYSVLEVACVLAVLFVFPRHFQHYYSSMVLLKALFYRTVHRNLLFTVQTARLFFFSADLDVSYVTLICCCCIYLQFDQIFSACSSAVHSACVEQSQSQGLETMAQLLFFTDVQECSRICLEHAKQVAKLAEQTSLQNQFDSYVEGRFSELQVAKPRENSATSVLRDKFQLLQAYYGSYLFLFRRATEQDDRIMSSYQLLSILERGLQTTFERSTMCPFFQCHLSYNLVNCLLYILSFADYDQASIQVEMTNPFAFQKQQILLNKAQVNSNSQVFITKIGNTHAILSNIQQKHYVFFQIDRCSLKPGVLQIYNTYILNENYQIEKLRLELEDKPKQQHLYEIKLVLDILRCFGISLLENQNQVSLFIPQRHRHTDRLVHCCNIIDRCQNAVHKTIAREYILRHANRTGGEKVYLYDDHVRIGEKKVALERFDFWDIQNALADN